MRQKSPDGGGVICRSASRRHQAHRCAGEDEGVHSRARIEAFQWLAAPFPGDAHCDRLAEQRTRPHPAARIESGGRATFSRDPRAAPREETGRHFWARNENFQALAAPFPGARDARADFQRAWRCGASRRVRPAEGSPRTGHGGQGGGRRLVETARRLSEGFCGRRGFYGMEHLIVSTGAREQR